MPADGFTRGPDVKPGEALENWMANNSHAMFRLPVTIRVGAAFLGVQIEEAWVGADPEGALRLALDDSGMMTALLDHLRNFNLELPGTHGVWLDGTWGRLVDVPEALDPPGSEAGGKPFAVREVLGPLRAGEGDHAFISG